LRNFGAGGSVLNLFFHKCGLKVRFSQRLSAKDEYLELFVFLVSNCGKHTVLTIPGFPVDNREKLHYMVQKKVKCLCVVRDPISVYKTLVNHRGYMPQRKMIFSQYESFKTIFNGIRYRFYDKGKDIVISHTHPTLDSLYSPVYIDNGHERFNLNSKTESLKSISDLIYVDMKDILPDRISKTLLMISNQFDIELPRNIYSFFSQPLNGGRFLYLLPKTLILEKKFLKKRFCVKSKNDVKISITQSQFINSLERNMTNITSFLDEIVLTNNLLVFTDANDELLNSNCFIDFIRKYLRIFTKKLLLISEYENSKLFNEEDILNCLKHDVLLQNKFKKMFDEELLHIRKFRPDIIKSWNYYQEFERMVGLD
ncbi:DUF2972 domain-containing protein, partial [Campylobacter lari]|nr:DUF2972 domain-containing protein [Campylobacter lari]